MAIYPGAVWKPVTSVALRKMVSPKRINHHIAVSETSSLHTFFQRFGGGVCSHFYILKNGKIEQYMDTKYCSQADLEGNSSTISIEYQGGVKNANGEKYTERQLEAGAKLSAWLMSEHPSIPNRIASSSKNDSSSHGTSWHRLGIDGNFPALPSILAGRQQRGGGMKYSNARGKACPGDARIKQIPELHERIQEFLGLKPKKPKKKTPKGKKYNIRVDGFWGPQTTRALQDYLGTPVDGVISAQRFGKWNSAVESMERGNTGSMMVEELQRRLKKKKVHGFLSKGTIKLLQKHLGTTQDSHISSPSQMVKELQRRLRDGTLTL